LKEHRVDLSNLTKTRYSAFIPAPLPRKLSYDGDLVLALSHADAALSELSGLGRHLPNPHLLIAPYVRREAVLSSRIEGTTTSLAELLLEEVAAGATRLLKVSNPTARQAVSRLEKAGMLTEVTGRDWGRLYLARSILRAIDKGDVG
jgi:Fic family protein